MDHKAKAVVTVVLVGLVVGAMSLTTDNDRLYKGQIFNQDDAAKSTLLPDLVPKMELIMPADGEEDLKVKATLLNSGEGEIASGNPFGYTIYINDQEVFSNTDSYSSMLSGDEFSFVYPISKAIYSYPDTGVVKFSVDTKNTITESDENNNQLEVNYNL